MTHLSAVRDEQEQAAFWDARLRSPHCSDEDRAEFKRWQEASEANANAFDQLQLTLTAMRASAERPEVRGLRDEVIAGLERRSRSRWAIGLAAAASLVLAVGVGTVQWSPTGPEQGQFASANHAPHGRTAAPADRQYQTALNERATVTLEDGSTVVLNSNSRLETAYDEKARRVSLLAGQALFYVAHNPSRPFVVQAGNRQIVALGTSFDIRVDKGTVRLTMIEGKVAVRPIGAPLDEAAIGNPIVPNQQLAFAIDSPSATLKKVDAEKAVAWKDGRVFFDDTPLFEAVSEMNRYSETQLVVADPRLNEYRINGMFRTGNQTSFAQAIESYFPIDIYRDRQKRIVLSAR